MKEFADISARFKKKREDAQPVVEERNFEEIYALRSRVLGVLLRDARLAHGDSVENVAQALQTTPETVNGWELGQSAPSLPQLELLAYLFDIPVSHFWRNKMIGAQGEKPPLPVPPDDYDDLRNRVIGVRLTVARKEAKLSQEELGKATGLSVEQLSNYEYGRVAVPFPELQTLASALGKLIGYFLEDSGRLGSWLQLQEEYDRFAALPEDVRAFVTQHNNQPFIEIAMRLSQLPLQELRTVGEKILDITL